MEDMKIKLNVLETSISGEIGSAFVPQGSLCTIIRLQGCNLSCSYCDAKEAIESTEHGNEVSLDTLLSLVCSNNLPVLLTGGEPLCQRSSVYYLLRHITRIFRLPVIIETNGTIPLTAASSIDDFVCSQIDWTKVGIIFDYKTHLDPSILWNAIANTPSERLRGDVVIKTVIKDLLQLKQVLHEFDKIQTDCYLFDHVTKFAFSPLDGDPLLAKRIAVALQTNTGAFRRARLRDCVVSLQLHKIVGMH